MARPSDKTDLLQGTLDLLILQVAALGAVHGYAMAQRLNQISKEALQVQQGSLYPALHRLEKTGRPKGRLGRRRERPRREVLHAHRRRAQTPRSRADGMGSPQPRDQAGASDGKVG